MILSTKLKLSPKTPYNKKERAAIVPPFLKLTLTRPPDRRSLCAGCSENATPIGYTEAVTLTSLEAHVAGIKIAFHSGLDRRAVKHFEAVRRIRLDEERIRVGEEVVNHRTFRKHTHVADRIGIIVRRARTQVGVHNTLSNELKLFWNDKLHATNSDLESTLIRKPCDINQHLLKRGLVEIRCHESRLRWLPDRDGCEDEQSAAPSPIAFAPVLNALFRIAAALICLV